MEFLEPTAICLRWIRLSLQLWRLLLRRRWLLSDSSARDDTIRLAPASSPSVRLNALSPKDGRRFTLAGLLWCKTPTCADHDGERDGL